MAHSRRRRSKKPHDRRRESDRRWFKKHPECIPTCCQVCNKTGVKLQFHHERYDIPRVGKFICEECHMNIHGVKPNLEKRRMKEKNKYWMFSKNQGDAYGQE
jgi:hypothetical protein